jgi:mono/diheme cytochrome c family protein
VKQISGLKYVYGTLFIAILLVAFNNCGEGFVAERLGATGGLGGGVFFSRAPGESCEDALMKVYQTTYHPFLSQTCNSCHINGPGIGTFANPDLKASFDSFLSVGPEKISNQALNDAHHPPYTGSQNGPLIAEFRASWASSQDGYLTCVAENGGGGATGSVVRTTAKAVAANLGTTNFVRMEWDLETQSSGKVPLVAGIEIRQGALGGVTRGYEYRNPTLRLKTASSPYQARALNIYVNNQLQSDVTTYSNLDVTVSAITDLNLSPGTSNAFNVRTVAATDTIALEFSSLKLASASATPTPTPAPPGGTPPPTPTPGTPTPTPSPTPTPTPIVVPTFTQLAGTGGLFKDNCFSCHTGATAAGALDLSVFAQAKGAAALIKARVNNAANPMPKGGLLPQAQRDQISAWVDAGAPQ